jgi:hypothetical protein
MTQKPFLTTLLAILLLAACKKEKNNPDDYIVRVGNQAFGVYLNGQPWVADYRDAGNGVEPIDIAILKNTTYNYYYMWIRALKSNEEISLYIPPPLVPGRILLNTTTFPWPLVRPKGAYGMYSVYTPSKKFITNKDVNGYIDILSADTLLKKIEAKFEFEAIDSVSNQKIRITNGYFKKGN